MKTKEEKNNGAIEKAIYIFLSASPGAFRILILLALGVISNTIQGEVANDLAIVSFMTMITAIGAGTHLLHITPKRDSANEYQARSTLKSSITKLIPLILLFCLTLYIFNAAAYNILSSGLETSILLFTNSIYWIFRHYYLARENKIQLIKMEAWLWLSTSCTVVTLSISHLISTKTFLISLSFSYTASFIIQLIITVLHPVSKDLKIARATLSIGLSNLVSGGIINLAPSICYNLGNASITGTVGLIINTTSITLTLIRAQLYKTSPSISSAISNHANDIIKICKTAQSRITKTIVITSILLQPINIFLSIKTQSSHDLPLTICYSALITLLICIPQLCAVNSTVANFVGRTGSMLIANLSHAAVTLAATYVTHQLTKDGNITFLVFLSISSALFIARNSVINHIIFNEIKITSSKLRLEHE